MRFAQDGDIRTSARITVGTFKHICSLPFVDHPKGVSLAQTFFNAIQSLPELW